ncbi:hypothetical protein [Halococcus thailandensis]|uniref:Uncharacterized protein n=1 Tax=Halococcus thailandensis JCM 13552 TaxID=1227457 RepID=M0NJK1_9EURY|nr:hypothetical protein [Halococcus thailandensis]EMA56860.1 hypothetical protein C451_00150 [Halococcus thailandensis JCM 13552]
MAGTPRRTLAIMLVIVLISSGCLTLGPSISADTGDSAVFESVTVDEPWASEHVRVNATLRSTPAASNVTTITIIGENKQTYGSISVGSGQSVVPLWIPANRNATLVASNSVNSTTLDSLNVSTGGNQLP